MTVVTPEADRTWVLVALAMLIIWIGGMSLAISKRTVRNDELVLDDEGFLGSPRGNNLTGLSRDPCGLAVRADNDSVLSNKGNDSRGETRRDEQDLDQACADSVIIDGPGQTVTLPPP